MAEKKETHSCLTRRSVLKAALGLSLSAVDFASAQDNDPAQARPQENDWFVFAYGERKGEIIGPQDLQLDGPQVFSYPMDPTSKLIRDGSRLNQVMLLRLDPEELSERTRPHSAQGIVAYTAICPHTGCDVSEWNAETKNFVCPCHLSEFDPRIRARVLFGPATRQLPMLPLKLEAGTLMVAGTFLSRVGFEQPMGGFP